MDANQAWEINIFTLKENMKMDKRVKVKVGIVGFGYMGRFHYIKTKQIEDAITVGIFDVSDDPRLYAREEGLKVYDSFLDMLSDEIDLVVISTPNDSHYEYAKLALENGKNVLCEKPVVLHLNEAYELIKLAEDNGLIFTVHQNRRWDKDFSVIKKVVNSKVLGDVVTIWSETFGQRGVCFGWRADPEHGGGMLYDWGIHLIDQILMLFKGKKVISVYGNLRSILTPVVDDYFEIELKLEDDITVHITMGTFSLIEKPRWFVISDKGTIKLDDFSGIKGDIKKIKDNVRSFARVKENSSLGPSRTLAHLEWQNFEEISLPLPDDEPMEFWRNLVAAVKGEEEQYITQDEIIRDMLVLEKVIESSKLKQRLEVNI